MKEALAMMFNADISSGDLVGGTTLATDEWLNTVVYTSLFTNAYAEPDQRPADDDYHGGYWGDAFHPQSMGSLLWTMRREKLTPDKVQRVIQICDAALAWIIKAKVAKAIAVEAESLVRDRLSLLIRVTRNDGTELPIQQEFTTNAV